MNFIKAGKKRLKGVWIGHRKAHSAKSKAPPQAGFNDTAFALSSLCYALCTTRHTLTNDTEPLPEMAPMQQF